MNTAAEEIWAILREVAQSQKESDRIVQEAKQAATGTDTTLGIAERDDFSSDNGGQQINDIDAMFTRLGGRLDDFIRDKVRPSAKPLFHERGIPVYEERLRAQYLVQPTHIPVRKACLCRG
jgi:hypothetical protein